MPFSWTAHPASEQRGRAAMGLCLVIAIAVTTFFSFGIYWAIGAAAVLIISLNRFFFPSRFTIDAEHIHARYLLRTKTLAWRHVRRFAHDRNGGFLSSRARPSWFDAQSGMHILFGNHRDEIVTLILHQIKAPGKYATIRDDSSRTSESALTAEAVNR